MTSSGFKLNFGKGFWIGIKNQRRGTDSGEHMTGTGRGEVKWPPYHDELTTVQHPNSKSRPSGFEVLRRRNSFQGFAALQSYDIDVRCDKLDPVEKSLLSFTKF